MTIKDIVIEKLRTLDVCQEEDDTQFTVRCPYCGDSKNPEHAHLGFLIDRSDPQMPILWNCLRCGEGGILSDKVLDDLGIPFTSDEFKTYKDYDRKLTKLANSKQNLIRIAKYQVPPDISDRKYLYKLQYVIDRLGQRVRPVENKIILSLKDFMAHNEITAIPGIAPWRIALLDKYYVGFLSVNNNCITFRCTIDSDKMLRYDKILINPYLDDIGSFYSIPTRMDFMYTNPVHVHITEGTFDVLSVRYNLDPNPSEDRLFYASCGFSYVSILKHLIRSGICTDLILHIYADKDKSDRKHRQILRDCPLTAFVSHVYLHRNAYPGEKDYGVEIECIRDTARKLW